MSPATRRPVPALLLAALLLAVPSAAFGFVRSTLSATDATPLRWDLDETMLPLSNVQSGEIVWVFDVAGSSNLPGPEDAEAVQRAFDHWEGIGSSRVAFVRGADQDVQAANNDGINVVYWAEGAHTVIGGTNTSVTGFVSLTPVFSVASGANKGLIMDANIVLNGRQETWTVTPESDGFWDVEAVVTHEIGHFIGLDHSPVLGSSMAPRFLSGESRMRMLQLDDILGASTIYPDGDFSTAYGAINGSVGRPAGVFGALVTVLDSGGRVIQESITAANGAYTAPGLASDDYDVYVEPVDATPASSTNLFDETDLGGVYGATVDPNFFAALPLLTTVTAPDSTVRSFLVGGTPPAINIAKIGGRASTLASLVFRTAPTFLVAGDSDVLLGFAGPNLDSSVVVEITGPGITDNGLVSTGSVDGEPYVVRSYTVSPSAPQGLRSVRINAGGAGRTYATGAIRVYPNLAMNFASPGVFFAVPGEVNRGLGPQIPLTLTLSGNDVDMLWDDEPGAYGYNVYRGSLTSLKGGIYDHAPIPGDVNGQCRLTTPYTVLKGEALDPSPVYYLVTAFNNVGEGIIGRNSSNQPIPGPATPCPVP